MSFIGNLFHHPNSPEDIAKRNAARAAENAAQPPHINSPDSIQARQASVGHAPILSEREREEGLDKLVDVIGDELSKPGGELNKIIGDLGHIMHKPRDPSKSASPAKQFEKSKEAP